MGGANDLVTKVELRDGRPLLSVRFKDEWGGQFVGEYEYDPAMRASWQRFEDNAAISSVLDALQYVEHTGRIEANLFASTIRPRLNSVAENYFLDNLAENLTRVVASTFAEAELQAYIHLFEILGENAQQNRERTAPLVEAMAAAYECRLRERLGIRPADVVGRRRATKMRKKKPAKPMKAQEFERLETALELNARFYRFYPIWLRVHKYHDYYGWGDGVQSVLKDKELLDLVEKTGADFGLVRRLVNSLLRARKGEAVWSDRKLRDTHSATALSRLHAALSLGYSGESTTLPSLHTRLRKRFKKIRVIIQEGLAFLRQ